MIRGRAEARMVEDIAMIDASPVDEKARTGGDVPIDPPHMHSSSCLEALLVSGPSLPSSQGGSSAQEAVNVWVEHGRGGLRKPKTLNPLLILSDPIIGPIHASTALVLGPSSHPSTNQGCQRDERDCGSWKREKRPP